MVEHHAAGAFRFNTIGFSVTNRCPLRCAHCITMSGPLVGGQEMSLDDGLKFLAELDGVVGHVSFTGGEPLLRADDLEQWLRAARGHGYLASVMTSGFWARDLGTARRRFERLVDAGMERLGVSLDRYHLEFVDTSAARHLAELGDEFEIPVRIRVVATESDDFPAQVHRELAHTNAQVERNKPIRIGRAHGLPAETFTPGPVPLERCESITAANVVSDGTVYACCGPGHGMNAENPLVLGNAHEEPLGAIMLRAQSNSFVRVINARGPSGLIEDLEASTSAVPFKPKASYTDICELCMDVCNNREVVEELRQVHADEARRQDQDALLVFKAKQSLVEAINSGRATAPDAAVHRPHPQDAPDGLGRREPRLDAPDRDAEAHCEAPLPRGPRNGAGRPH